MRKGEGGNEGSGKECNREERLGLWKREKGWLGNERKRGMGPLRRLAHDVLTRGTVDQI